MMRTDGDVIIHISVPRSVVDEAEEYLALSQSKASRLLRFATLSGLFTYAIHHFIKESLEAEAEADIE